MQSLADGSPVSHQTLESERLAHSQLCDIVKDLSLAFGPQLVSYLFCVFLEHLARFYFMTYHPESMSSNLDTANNVKALQPLMFIVHSWIGVYLIAYLSDKVTESVNAVLKYCFYSIIICYIKVKFHSKLFNVYSLKYDYTLQTNKILVGTQVKMII